MFTVQQLATDVKRRVSPANPAESADFFGAVSDAGRTMLANISPKELSRRVEIENALYDQVHRFKCPEDLDKKNVMQWYELDGMKSADRPYQQMMKTGNRVFDQRDHKQRKHFTVEWESGVKFLKVDDFSGDVGLTIHKMNSISENGTWNVFGNAVDLRTDPLNYVSGTGSLQFDLNSSSNTGGIENFTLEPVDISEYFTIGKVFTWVYVPNLNELQRVRLQLISSPGNYYEIEVMSPHDTNQFQLGWNLLGFPFDNNFMQTNGSPNPSNINHIKIEFEVNGQLLMNEVRVDNIVLRKGAAYGVQYLSEYLFEDPQTGLWVERPTDAQFRIHVEQGTYQVLLGETAKVLAYELFTGNRAQQDMEKIMRQLEQDYFMYRKKNKTEFIDEQQSYYNFGVEYGFRGGNRRLPGK
jgi:hypothetical protein